MKVSLQSPMAKIFLLGLSFLFTALFLVIAGSQYLATVLSERNDLASLQRAVRLQPGNADYRYRLGWYFYPLQADAAVRSLQAAVALNPAQANYWLALAQTYGSVGNEYEQNQALQSALRMGSTDPAIIWQAANIYYSHGDVGQTLDQCQKLLGITGATFDKALPFCWQVKPDADLFTQGLLPRSTDDYQSFLDLLISQKDTASSAKAWESLVDKRIPMQRQPVLEYVHYLIDQRQPEIAAKVWQEAATISDVASYQPSDNNLIVNGDFRWPILNGGFDWSYEKSNNVSLSLDANNHDSSLRSLHIAFNDAQIEDAGIRHYVTVAPNSGYDLSADFQAKDLEGAGGIRLAIQDAYAGSMIFSSDDLANTNGWKKIHGTFTTPANSKLLIVRLQRVPAGDVIKGNLWIDNVRMTKAQQP
ncbi:MAG TPA: carbohydrate binding domain-containing protein [Terriglobales bacterium]